VTDGTSGDVKGRHDFLPFGYEIDASYGGRSTVAGYGLDWSQPKFTGKERDYESGLGLDFFETRYLSSAQGRFSSPDKFPWWNLQHSEKEEDKKKFEDYVGNPQNWNMYAYVLNNPLNHTDPTGMLGCKVGDQAYTTCTITVVYDPKTSKGTLTVTGQNKGDKKATLLLTANVVVGGDGHPTPTGNFHAANWEKDHTSKLYGWQADTPWSKSPLGLNALGPYQLHIKELESRGIWIHGTMGPGWSPTTSISGVAVSSTSHGCVRMCNRDDIQLFKMMPNPVGNPIKISTNPTDLPRR
jgi:RHS repeat-associated protein